MTLLDFTLSNVRRFYSSMGNPVAVKGFKIVAINAISAGGKLCQRIDYVSPEIGI